MDCFFLVLLGVAVICTSIPVDSFYQEKNCIGIDVHTEAYGDDVEWSFGACSSLDEYEDHATFTETCCQPPGNYELVCKSRHGLGWRGGFIHIDGSGIYCQESMADSATEKNSGKYHKEMATMPQGGPCVSSNGYGSDNIGDRCTEYIGNEDQCGDNDNEDFQAELMCCACVDNQDSKIAERICKTCKTVVNNGFYDFACGNPLLCPESCGVCGSCENTNKGATDPFGDGCDAYFGNENWCGNFDGPGFTSKEMCCACGGGIKSA